MEEFAVNRRHGEKNMSRLFSIIGSQCRLIKPDNRFARRFVNQPVFFIKRINSQFRRRGKRCFERDA